MLQLLMSLFNMHAYTDKKYRQHSDQWFPIRMESRTLRWLQRKYLFLRSQLILDKPSCYNMNPSTQKKKIILLKYSILKEFIWNNR